MLLLNEGVCLLTLFSVFRNHTKLMQFFSIFSWIIEILISNFYLKENKKMKIKLVLGLLMFKVN